MTAILPERPPERFPILKLGTPWFGLRAAQC
jgi:hypothetical protein